MANKGEILAGVKELEAKIEGMPDSIDKRSALKSLKQVEGSIAIAPAVSWDTVDLSKEDEPDALKEEFQGSATENNPEDMKWVNEGEAEGMEGTVEDKDLGEINPQKED